MSKKILNYRYISRKLTGKDFTIRSNFIPKNYKEKINELENLVNSWEKGDSIYFNSNLPEIKDLKLHLENVDNRWYNKNDELRTAYELGASNTFYWMRKEIEK